MIEELWTRYMDLRNVKEAFSDCASKVLMEVRNLSVEARETVEDEEEEEEDTFVDDEDFNAVDKEEVAEEMRNLVIVESEES